MILKSILLLLCFNKFTRTDDNIPIVVTTWAFVNSTIKAWDILKEGGLALDAIEQGASVCEEQQCDGTVGYGGSPDENGETTLDALIMDGKTMNVGAVGCLRRIKNAISVARHVLEHTKHSFLVGELATEFAIQMGFHEESLTTTTSKHLWKEWHNDKSCQPNFWIDVLPVPNKFCGPYKPVKQRRYNNHYEKRVNIDRFNHDTIGMIAIDKAGNVVAGTSTNGAKYKIPGRIGDSPIPGAGAYADNEVGGAAATGDGDIMLRFLPSFLAVEEMRRGASPKDAAKTAVSRIIKYYPSFMGAVVALSKNGQHGAACHGIDIFPYVIAEKNTENHSVILVNC